MSLTQKLGKKEFFQRFQGRNKRDFRIHHQRLCQIPLLESLEKIVALGFRGVEIMGDRPHLYPPDFDAADVAAVKETLKKHNLKVTNLNSFTLFAVGDTYLPSWIEPDKERRDIRIRHTLECLEMAEELGCRNISVPPGGPLNGMTRRAAMSLFHRGLEQVVPGRKNST